MIPLLVMLVVVPGTVGDLLNSAGMKRQGELTDWSLHGLAQFGWETLRNPYILIGIPAMAVSFFALMALLSASAISFAIPMTASSYILETALAKYLLKEDVSWQRWVGAALVAIGVALMAL